MSKPSILVVEDDPILRQLTKKQVTTLGCDCVVVGSGEAAVEQDLRTFSLILMDVGLPGIDGIHATMLIREKELRQRLKRVPIVALTGHSDKVKALAVGMDDFLQKPALLADIRQVLETWISDKPD